MIKVTERGWAGHFTWADRCLFKRNTLIESDNDKVIVSTVGAMRSLDEKGIEMIGHNRFYETMVFGAVQRGHYIDADIDDMRTFRSDWAINAKSWQDLPDDVNNKANEMHENVVTEMIQKLEENENSYSKRDG